MKSFNELNNMICSSDYDLGRFDYMMEQIDDCEISGIDISRSFILSIKRFLENTDPYNQLKIEELINNNIRNIKRVKRIIIDYNNIKEREYFNEEF